MSDEEALNGAGEAHVVGVAERIQGLEHQLVLLTQMVQTGVKLETHGREDRESMKIALNKLDGGPVFNKVVAAQYHQAKQQQLPGKLEVLQLQNAVRENVETWETASILYKPFKFNAVRQEERKFVRLLAKYLMEVDWSTQSG